MHLSELRVGVLELHGDFAEHTAMLHQCGATNTVSVRQLESLENLDALVLPGGESTVMGKLLNELGMLEKVQAMASEGLPMFGTCAGCILLARDLPQYPDQPRIGAMGISVDRNTYGRQIDSFQTNVDVQSDVFSDGRPLSVVHIRAPGIMEKDADVEVLAQHDGRPILVRQGALLGATFHPEITDDTRVHELFLRMVLARKEKLGKLSSSLEKLSLSSTALN